MAREQQFNNTGRQVINTIEDTSKYQTGDSRRLRVVADPLRIQETPAVSELSKLTEALGTVKPTLMNWAINKQAENERVIIEAGKRKAQSGDVPQGELEQFGYDNVKAVNDWTEFNQKVLSEYDQNFDKENGNLEEFLKAQWESHPFSDKSPTYLNKFTPLAGKSMAKIRTAHATFKADLTESRNDAELVRMFSHDINDVMGAGQDYGVSQYEARRANLQALFPGKTNSQLDELAYQAVLGTMEATGDTSLVNIFKQPHSDKTPGLYEIPKWKTKIDADVHRVLAAKNSERDNAEKAMEKQLKDAAQTYGRKVLFALTDINTFDDPTVRDAKIRELNEEARKISESGIPIEDSIIKAIQTAATTVGKKEETAYQSQNYVRLRLANPSTQRIAQAFNSGDISQAGFDKLMTRVEAASNRADKSDKPLSSNPYVKQAMKEITTNAGYSWGSMTPGNEQAKKNADAVNARMLDMVEELIDSGVSVKDASAQGVDWGIKVLKESGMHSKALAEANKKIDAVELKRTNPVKYYTDNPQAYLQDVKTKAVPQMAPKDLLVIQKKALAAASSNRLKNHESTR